MKDTNNKLGYNTWSGTDYTNNTNNFYAGNCNINPSNEYSIIGESSLKITTNNSASWGFVDLQRLTGISGSCTATLDVYAPKGGILIQIYASGSRSSVTVPQNDDFQHISLSGALPNSYEFVVIRCFPRVDNVSYYIDNVSLHAS